ncbi:MAG: hypothetical protein VW687_04285 [Curvibacter sp.]
MKPYRSLLLTSFGAILAGTAAAQAPQTCEQAWAQYNDFRKNNEMEPGRYAYTVYGANVRALCGADALPVPPGTDTPPRILRRPPPPPPKPPEKPQPPR